MPGRLSASSHSKDQAPGTIDKFQTLLNFSLLFSFNHPLGDNVDYLMQPTFVKRRSTFDGSFVHDDLPGKSQGFVFHRLGIPMSISYQQSNALSFPLLNCQECIEATKYDRKKIMSCLELLRNTFCLLMMTNACTYPNLVLVCG